MKLKTFIAAVALLVGFSANAAEPVLIPGSLSEIYVPDGFDSNDHVQITGHGILPSTCYKPGYTDWKLVNGKDIVLSPTVYYYSGYCLQMISHTYVTFEIGVLPKGQYRVILEKSGEVIGRLSVRQARTDSADDFLYAPISQAYYEKVGRKHMLKISGEFSNSCLSLKEVRTEVQPNVIVVLPISELKSRTGCADGKFPFERSVDLGRLNAGNYLLHIRSLNGKSVNNLVEVQ